MLIKITEHCSMGCSHCMNNSLPNNKHMSIDVFIDAINFVINNEQDICFISGGEPTEHPLFLQMLDKCLNEDRFKVVVVTTNGKWLEDKYDLVNDYYNKYNNNPSYKLIWQVTNDPKYYPYTLNFNLPAFKVPNVVTVNEINNIYPQGRALENKLKYTAKGSKCFNVRALSKQFKKKNSKTSFKDILNYLACLGKFCTPHIGVNGDIKLGESDLCPVCSNIYKSDNEILNDIINFKCHQCDMVNDKLDSIRKKFIE